MTEPGFLIDSGWATRARIEQGMSLATAELPDDAAALRVFALACQSELKAAETAVQLKALEIEKLRFQIAKLRRMQFGRSSERIARQIVQLEFQLEELESGAAEDIARAEAAGPSAPASPRANRPKRKPLPDHLPRQDVVHQPAGDGACTCPDCGGRMARLGEDVTEVLDYVPGHFQVIRHVRPKFACCACDAITQAPAPTMPTPRGRATPATLAHLLVAKYCDHLPLYRQSEIYAREGLELDRSTLSDWVGQAAWLLDPVVAAIRRHVFAAEKIHGDDTTVPVLAPGLGRTKTGRLWVYVRDDRPFCGIAPPAAAYFYSPDRRGEHPASHMATFAGLLQADGYAGFEALYGARRAAPGPITEVACWAHCRRGFFDEWEHRKSPVAKERRSTASPRSMSSRPRPHSPPPPSEWHCGPRPLHCSRHSSHGPRRPWQNCRQSRRWPSRSAIPSRGAKRSAASSPTVGWKSTTTLPRTPCESSLWAARIFCSPGRTPAAIGQLPYTPSFRRQSSMA